MNEKNSKTIAVTLLIIPFFLFYSPEEEKLLRERGDAAKVSDLHLVIDTNDTFHIVYEESPKPYLKTYVKIAQSKNGREWSIRELLTGSSPSLLQDKNGRYILNVVVSLNTSPYYEGAILVSSDGVQWDKIPDSSGNMFPEGTIIQDTYGKYWVGSVSMLRDENIFTHTAVIRYSNDLINWSSPTVVSSASDTFYSLSLYYDLNNRLSFLYSSRSTTWLSTSLDGINWSKSKLPYGEVQSMLQLPNGTYYAAAIRGGTKKPNGVYFITSVDGKNWSMLSTGIELEYYGLETTTQRHLSLAYDSNFTLWLAFDDTVWNSSGVHIASDIWLTSSKDGVNWEEPIRITHNEKKMEPKKKVNFLGNSELLTTTAVIVFVAMISSMYKKKFKRIRI